MTQIKFTVDSVAAASFKAKCAREGVSMTSEIRRFIKTCQPSKVLNAKTSTRALRRKAVVQIIGILNEIMDQEIAYRDNIPEVFTEMIDAASNACEQLSEAICCLEEVF